MKEYWNIIRHNVIDYLLSTIIVTWKEQVGLLDYVDIGGHNVAATREFYNGNRRQTGLMTQILGFIGK